MLNLWENDPPHFMAQAADNVPRLDPFPLPQSRKPAAAVIICPGGGYTGRADHEGKPVAQWLNSLGIAGFVLHYRVSPHRHPVPLLDAQRAIRLVRHRAKEWNVDPDSVGIMGFSAGGHLASTAATRFDSGNTHAPDPVEQLGCRPDAAILCYPVITLGAYTHQGSKDNLLGVNPPADLARSLSSELNVTPGTPPAFLWHTCDDDAVPVQNPLLFAEALGRHGVPFAMHIFAHGNHGLGLAQDDPAVGKWTQLAADWLKNINFIRGGK